MLFVYHTYKTHPVMMTCRPINILLYMFIQYLNLQGYKLYYFLLKKPLIKRIVQFVSKNKHPPHKVSMITLNTDQFLNIAQLVVS